ncbi:MAG: DUF1501 domain-containing protein [Planctomycetota bacterium]
MRAPVVTVFWPNDGITNVSVYWDTHARNFIDLSTRLCPVTDRAFAALLDDLNDRRMLDETPILWTGEMGRTPRVGQSVVGGTGAAADGRDHWPKVFTSVMAGGGIRGGAVYGASDRYAAEPACFADFSSHGLQRVLEFGDDRKVVANVQSSETCQ